MARFSISEEELETGKKLTEETRTLIKARRNMEARHKLVKILDIFLNAKPITGERDAGPG